jgi:hypothetical protein
VRSTVSTPAAALALVFGCRLPALHEVLAPGELRQALARKAAKTATLYVADANR